MNRRRFVQLFGGLTLAGIPITRPQLGQARIVVAGGGILGASISYHLAKRGAHVVLLEKERPAAGATGNSFAWLNASPGKQPWHYHLLNRLGLEGWRHLHNEWSEELEVQWGGTLEWYGDSEGAERLREQLRRHQAWGYAGNLVNEEELRILESNLEPGPVVAGAHWEQEGTVDPIHAVEVLLAKAREQGAEIVHPCEVTGLDIRAGRLRGVRASCGDFEADVLVVACGVDTPSVAAMAGLSVPLVDAPGTLAHTVPESRLIDSVIRSPGPNMKQKVDGRVVVGAGFEGSPGTDHSREAGERILEKAARFLPALGTVDLDQVTLGWRPLPKDGHPVIGFPDRSPNIYLTVMHSGMTLAPVIGRLAAVEILDQVQVDLLEHYRLTRFADLV